MFSKCITSFLLPLIMMIYAGESFACSYAYPLHDYEKVVADSDVVFAGIVKSTTPDDMDSYLFGTFSSEIEIFESYKGWPVNGRVEVNGTSNDCWNNRWPFEPGKMRIIIANYDGRGNLTVHHHFSALNQRKLLNFLVKGEGKDSPADCLGKVLENLKQRPAPAKSPYPIQGKADLDIGQGCFKKDENEDNPFRFIPPAQ